jgi:hypothetical protein
MRCSPSQIACWTNTWANMLTPRLLAPSGFKKINVMILLFTWSDGVLEFAELRAQRSACNSPTGRHVHKVETKCHHTCVVQCGFLVDCFDVAGLTKRTWSRRHLLAEVDAFFWPYVADMESGMHA